jgi:hypothetical protein
VPVPVPPVAKARTDVKERTLIMSGQPCIFEKPEKKNGQLLSLASVECTDVPLSSAFLFSPFFLHL